MKKNILLILLGLSFFACSSLDNYDSYGFDKNGMNIRTKSKYDEHGFNKERKNVYTRELYDEDGFDIDGINKNHRFSRETVERYPFIFNDRWTNTLYINDKLLIKDIYKEDQKNYYKTEDELFKKGKIIYTKLLEIKKSKTEFETNSDVFERNEKKLESLRSEMGALYWITMKDITYDLNKESYGIYPKVKNKNYESDIKKLEKSNVYGAKIYISQFYKKGEKVDFIIPENYKEKYLDKFVILMSKEIAKQYPTKDLEIDFLIKLKSIYARNYQRYAYKIGDSEWDEDYISFNYIIGGYKLKYKGQVIKEEIF